MSTSSKKFQEVMIQFHVSQNSTSLCITKAPTSIAAKILQERVVLFDYKLVTTYYIG